MERRFDRSRSPRIFSTQQRQATTKQGRSNEMQEPDDASKQGPDDEMIAFASEVFEVARRGDAAMLDALLHKGLPPNLRNDRGDTLVMLASYHGHADAVRVLLEHKADPDLRNDRGQTPIAGAAFKGFMPVIEVLLDHGADVEGASPDGRTALMIAAMFNRVELVEYLIGRGANPDARDANGVSARDAAEKMGAPDTVARLAAATGARERPSGV
jgi:ankyrin repeat protein